MLKIGQFSKLSHTTVKALRFYEKQGLLKPASTDPWTGYRYYETSQLETAARIQAFRQMGLSIEQIRRIFAGEDAKSILLAKAKALRQARQEIALALSTIEFILEEDKMSYQITVKQIPEMIVYSAETVLPKYSDCMQWIPALGQMCMELNPGITCAEPPYEFCEYLDGEHKEENIRIRHSEAVTRMGRGNDIIFFRTLPAAKVLSIYHKGAYEAIGQTYAYIMAYAERNGYEVAGLPRESYIDGIWNKESVNDWLTEIQLPIK